MRLKGPRFISDNKCSHFHRCLFGDSLAAQSDTDDLTEMNLGATTVNGMLDENLVPKYGSKPVDFGDVNHYITNFPSAFTRFMWLDRRGAPRVSNGKIDCGAFEYDWRGGLRRVSGENRRWNFGLSFS